MPEPIEQVNVMLEGRMPHLRQEVKQLSAVPRKLMAKDGLNYGVTYLSANETLYFDPTSFHDHISAELHTAIHGTVVIANVDSPAKAESIIDRIGGEFEFGDACVLA
ncbi:MAG: hypothetical protein NTY98_03650, partial [Verrucomicrobia bacterium]|nr:hypothetical protein [Verrucomicrobiota bacterium]